MGLEQDLRAIWRPARIKSKRCDLSLQSLTAEGRNNEQATSSILGTIHNVLPVGRPVRLPILARPLGDLNRITAADLLDPNVEFSTSI